MKRIYRFIVNLTKQILDKYGLKIHVLRFLALIHAKKLPLNADRYLVVAPHPDDEVFGCAGLIHRLNRQGKDIHVVILTQGEAVHDEPLIDIPILVAKRRELTLNAAKILGLMPSQYTFLDWGDGNVPEVQNNINKKMELISIIETKKPEVIFTPHVTDGHYDHIYTTQIVRTMLHPSMKLMNYCVWFWKQGYRNNWNKSYILTMNKKEQLVKSKAIDAYILPVDEHGIPYSGDLVELSYYWRWRKELYFDAD